MNTFRFRLQQLLDFRIERQEKAQRDLAAALRDLEREEERLAVMYRELASSYAEWNQQRKHCADINDVLIYNRYLGRLERTIKTQLARIRQQEQLVVRVRALLLQATKDKKILERLKEKRHQEFVETVNRLEQDFLDEIAARPWPEDRGEPLVAR
jgi:flagellar FliJ protein